MSAMKPSPTAVLSRLLVEIFEGARAMKMFIRSSSDMKDVADALPEDTVSAVEMADNIASILGKRGFVTEDFFAELMSIRPRRSHEIQRAADAWSEGTHATPTGGNSTILLDPDGLDLVTLTVVSRRTGKSWKVSLSKHRQAGHAARDIFAATHINSNAHIAQILSGDEYCLCQNGQRYDCEILEDVLTEGIVVHVERRSLTWRAAAPATISPKQPNNTVIRLSGPQRRWDILDIITRARALGQSDLASETRIPDHGQLMHSKPYGVLGRESILTVIQAEDSVAIQTWPALITALGHYQNNTVLKFPVRDERFIFYPRGRSQAPRIRLIIEDWMESGGRISLLDEDRRIELHISIDPE